MEKKELVNLLETRMNILQEELKEGNLSSVQFPRTGEVAYVEISTRISVINWVLEMIG